jgi:hypothetical protein
MDMQHLRTPRLIQVVIHMAAAVAAELIVTTQDLERLRVMEHIRLKQIASGIKT